MALTQEMLGYFRQFAREGRLKGLLYYAWADDKYGVYRCNRLTEAGRLALDRSVNQIAAGSVKATNTMYATFPRSKSCCQNPPSPDKDAPRQLGTEHPEGF